MASYAKEPSAWGTFLSLPPFNPAALYLDRPRSLDDMALYISGTKRTGKSEFASNISTGSFSHEWIVYRDPLMTGANKQNFDHLLATLKGTKVCSFAEPIRNIIATHYSFPSGFDWDANKDSMLLEGKLLRKHMIEIGTLGREIDPGYWANRLIVDAIREDEPLRLIVADHRFPEEASAISTISYPYQVRLFREAVPMPQRGDKSETSLDNCPATWLAVPTKDEFEQCKWCLPVYRNYVPAFKIVRGEQCTEDLQLE